MPLPSLRFWTLGLTALQMAGVFFVPHAAKAAAQVPFTVNMSEAVVVTGTPRIAVDVGGQTRYAAYTSGSGTNTLTFTLTPQSGDLDLDGIAISSPLQLNGGTLKDTAGNDAALTFTLPNTSGIKVSDPSFSMDLVADADGRYTLNGTVYNDLTSFLTATGGTFTRASTATYFDSTGVMQTAASGVPRFDYDPTTLQPKGLLLEGSRTNYIPNSDAASATLGVLGSGGALPSGWSSSSTCGAGITRQVVAKGTLANGLNYVDLRIYGTNSSGVQCYPDIYFVGTSIAATSGQTYTFSIYAQLIAGSTANFGSPPYVCSSEANSGGSYITSTCTGLADSTFARRWSARTFNNASTAYARAYISLAIPNAATVDATYRFAAPQIERALTPTSYIPTTTVAVTRSSDVLTFPTGSWYNANVGSFMVAGDDPYLGGPNWPGLVSIDDGGASNSMQLFIDDASSDTKRSEVWAGGVNQMGTVGAVYTAGATLKQAMGYELNNSIVAMDGAVGTLDTSVSIPAVTMVRFAYGRGGGSPLYGHIRTFKYYPLRATNTQIGLLSQ